MKNCGNCSLAGTESCKTCSSYPYSYHIVNDWIASAIQPERKESNWIPCSEKLPENDERVLATTAWGEVTIAERVYPPISDTCWFIHDGNTNATIDDVVAWKPMPEPYRGEQK